MCCTSWDLDVWATKPPPWKWMSSQGERGCFCTQGRWEAVMGGGSVREKARSSSLSYKVKGWATRSIIRKSNREKCMTHTIMTLSPNFSNSAPLECFVKTSGLQNMSESSLGSFSFPSSIRNSIWCILTPVNPHLSFSKLIGDQTHVDRPGARVSDWRRHSSS